LEITKIHVKLVNYLKIIFKSFIFLRNFLTFIYLFAVRDFCWFPVHQILNSIMYPVSLIETNQHAKATGSKLIKEIDTVVQNRVTWLMPKRIQWHISVSFY